MDRTVGLQIIKKAAGMSNGIVAVCPSRRLVTDAKGY
jgi:hypothetical protein